MWWLPSPLRNLDEAVTPVTSLHIALDGFQNRLKFIISQAPGRKQFRTSQAPPPTLSVQPAQIGWWLCGSFCSPEKRRGKQHFPPKATVKITLLGVCKKCLEHGVQQARRPWRLRGEALGKLVNPKPSAGAQSHSLK